MLVSTRSSASLCPALAAAQAAWLLAIHHCFYLPVFACHRESRATETKIHFYVFMYFVTFIYCVCVCVYTCHHVCRSQKTTWASPFSHSTVKALRTEFRSPGLVARALGHHHLVSCSFNFHTRIHV